jgi:RNA polymerase sigma-70 factor (ECF subfamily)
MTTSALWSQFSSRLHAFLAKRVPPGIDPDDVLQEVFIRVQKNLPSLREEDRINAWMFQIARNVLTDAIRHAATRAVVVNDEQALERTADEAEPAATAEVELSRCLTPMIDRLEEPYRSAILATELGGMTQAEAATAAGVSVSGMKSRVQRAREQLKSMLSACCTIDVDGRGVVTDFERRKKGDGCCKP